MTNKTKHILIGVGIGVAVGGTVGTVVGYSVSAKRTRKRVENEQREARKAAYRKGYDRGFEDSMEEAKKWIDEFQENVVMVDPDDPEAALKAIQNASKTASKADSNDSTISDDQEHANSPEVVKTPVEGLKTPSKVVSDNEVEAIFASPKEPAGVASNQNSPKPPITTENPSPSETNNRYVLTGDNVVSIRYGTETFEYPKSLFYDENGYSRGETRIRANLLDYERNPVTLKKLWLSLGWGDYFPDPNVIALTEEELNNMDLDIDEQLGDEPEERTIERQRYLDKVEKFRENPVNSPKIVSQRRFDEDCYLNHIYVDYYDVDNIFVDSTEIEKELDAFMMFGVTDGKDLFKYKAEHPFDSDDDNNDPDVVHVENFFDNSIAEITRYHQSYASVKDGSAYLDGNPT